MGEESSGAGKDLSVETRSRNPQPLFLILSPWSGKASRGTPEREVWGRPELLNYAEKMAPDFSQVLNRPGWMAWYLRFPARWENATQAVFNLVAGGFRSFYNQEEALPQIANLSLVGPFELFPHFCGFRSFPVHSLLFFFYPSSETLDPARHESHPFVRFEPPLPFLSLFPGDGMDVGNGLMGSGFLGLWGATGSLGDHSPAVASSPSPPGNPVLFLYASFPHRRTEFPEFSEPTRVWNEESISEDPGLAPVEPPRSAMSFRPSG